MDQRNGPGTHFTDLPPAVAAAADGDTLIIRPGSYLQFSTGKALTLLGQGSVTVIAPIFSTSPIIEVKGLGAGKSLVVKNLRVVLFNGRSGIRLEDDAGRVHLEAVTCTGGLGGGRSALLDVVSCREVTVTGGSLRASHGTGLRAVGSTLSLCSVTVHGGHAAPRHAFCFPAAPGIELTSSIAYLSRTDVQGGNGARAGLGGRMVCQPAPAVVAVGGVLTVTGDARTTLAAGALAKGRPTPAITASEAIVDTRVALVPSQGGAKVRGRATFRRVVSLTAAGAPPGGVLRAEVVSPSRHLVSLLLSLPADPLATPFGRLFIDPVLFLRTGFVKQRRSEHLPIDIAVPLLAALRGVPLALQAADYDPPSGRLELSNPAVVILD